MRRRGPEFRRQTRRRISDWIWLFFGLLMAGGFLLFVLHHYHQYRPRIQAKEKKASKPTVTADQSFNLTQELLISTSIARQLSDQMTLSKAYVIIAKEHGNLQLAYELSAQIRNCQRLLSQAAVQSKPITLEEAHPVITNFAELIFKSQDLHYDIGTAITTLKSHAQALEERANAAIVQSAQFGQMAAEALPKSLHCINIRLLDEWFKNKELRKLADTHRGLLVFADRNLHHFCIFSDNVLAASVVVNSTTSNADHPKLFVFHIVTDGVNYRAMASWFMNTDYRGSSVEVRSIEELPWLNASPVSSYFDEDENKLRNSKSVLLLNHLRFYIPEIYPSLEKIVFLDDDVVVQKDLAQLFSLDLHGNVIGAVETCLESYHRFHKFLNFSDPLINTKFDPQACGWAFGVNVFDLVAWKMANVTARYQYWQDQNRKRILWTTRATLPVGLLAFYGLIEPLDRRWHVAGLGYDLEIDDKMIEFAAVLHFSGTMKPWLKLGFSKYKHLWTQYVDFKSPYLRDCMI